MGRLSAQVLQEFYVNATRKIRQPLARAAARDIVRDYALWIERPTTAATIARASEIEELAQLSFWDALIVASAEDQQAAELVSEDLQHGQRIAAVRIRNPFLPSALPGA